MLPHPLTELIAAWTEIQLSQAKQANFEDNFEPEFSTTKLSSSSPTTPLHQNLAHDSESPPPPRLVIDPNLYQISRLSYVAGLDISFDPLHSSRAVAVLCVLSFPDLQLVSTYSSSLTLSTPYVPSFLSFRESEHYVALVERCRREGGPVPQVLLVDGNGRWHARQAGCAVAVGLATGLPTIGVAKEFHPLTFDDGNGVMLGESSESTQAPPTQPEHQLSQKLMRAHCRTALAGRGSYLPLFSPSPIANATAGATATETPLHLGAALLSSPDKNSTSPIFVSSGHKVSLESCLKIVLACCTVARVPEPIRLADSIGREEIKAQNVS